MANDGRGKKGRVGALRDLQANFRDIQVGDVPPTKNCFLSGSLARSKPQEVWRGHHDKCVAAVNASWASDVPGYAGTVGGSMAPGMSEKPRTAIHYVFTHVLGSGTTLELLVTLCNV